MDIILVVAVIIGFPAMVIFIIKDNIQQQKYKTFKNKVTHTIGDVDEFIRTAKQNSTDPKQTRKDTIAKLVECGYSEARASWVYTSTKI